VISWDGCRMYHSEWFLVVRCVMEIVWGPLQPTQVVDTVFSSEGGLED